MRCRSRRGWPAAPRSSCTCFPAGCEPTTQAAVGADTVAALGQLRADVAFLGTNGLSVDHGLSTPDREEAATKRAMVASARRVVCLVDSSKIGAEAPLRFAALSDIDVVVTDDGISADDRRALVRAGVRVVVA